MALINLKTNLKSLKFGNDRQGGGSSNQPYMPDALPNLDKQLNNQNTDFLLRGGIMAPVNSVVDVARLGKYFADLKSPSGLLFITKQNLLSRTAVRTQASGKILNEGIYTPLSTLAEAGVAAFGFHLNKQGVNPFPGSVGSITTYSDVVKSQNQDLLGVLGNLLSGNLVSSNRLVGLYGVKITGEKPIYSSNGMVSTTFDSNNLFSYAGGPGSILGIGFTRIALADQRTGKFNPNYGKNPNYQKGIVNSFTKRNPLDVKKPTGVSDFYSKLDPKSRENIVSTLSYVKTNPLEKSSNNQYVSGLGLNKIYNYTGNKFGTNTGTVDESIEGAYTFTQQDLIDSKPFQYSAINGLKDFRNVIRERIKDNTAAKNNANIPDSPDYATKNIENRVNLGDPGNKFGKNLTSYSKGYNGSGAASANSTDKIMMKELYNSTSVSTEDTNDLVKFRIAAIDNNDPNNKVFIHFRAFLTNINDSYSGDVTAREYVGRGEKFYTYAGFDRKISLNFTVAAQSKAELIPMYKKLNYLASQLAPDYSEFGYMRGPLIQLTIGGYFYEQVGYLTSLAYDIPEESPWEIGIDEKGEYDSSVKELPHIIKVSNFSFTPIHDFVPKKAKWDKLGDTPFIALTNGSNSNY